MTEGAERHESSRNEQEYLSRYRLETLQYHNQQLALLITGERVTGERGTKFDWEKFKWTPYEPGDEGLVSTQSGNDYYIYVDDDERTWFVNTWESERTGNIVAVYQYLYKNLPPIAFGEPWNIPGFNPTSDVQSLLLKYKIGDSGHKIDAPIPFEKYRPYFIKPTS